MAAEFSDAQIQRLLEFVSESDISSVRVKRGDTEVFVSRVPVTESETAASAPVAAPQPDPRPPVDAGSGPPEHPMEHESQTENADHRVTVVAPMVGVFYRAPEPGQAPYVDVGAVVAGDTTVGLIETMKVYTAVPAGVEGRVAEVLVDNEQFVESGQALFVVTPESR